MKLRLVWVLEILPDTSAAPPKTRWNLKDGALYSFFPVAGSYVFLFEGFELSKIIPSY